MKGGGRTRAPALSPFGGLGAIDRVRPAPPREVVQLCSFLVGPEAYAVDIMRIKEIIKPPPLTRVPRAPAFVEGVIELRGAILPVVDLRRRFELERAPQARSQKFLIVSVAGLGAERWIVAVVVDRVLEVIRVPRDELRLPPTSSSAEGGRYFSSVCRHRDRIVLVIDLDGILSESERQGLAGMSQSAEPGPGLTPLDTSAPPPATPVDVGGGGGGGR
jgi:purine-binding chemotaxis protein CheW